MDFSSKASTSGEPQSQERNWGQRKRRSLSKKLEECNSEPKKVLSVSKLKRSPKPVTRPTSTSSKQNSDLKVSQVSFKASMPLLELHRLENFEKIDKLELNLKNSSMETVPMNPITRPSPDSIKIPVLECPEKSDNIISESPVLFSNALKKKGDPLEFFSNAKSNVESLASFTNLPTTVGAFEIRLNGSQLSQELHAKERHSSGNSFSVPVSSGITTLVSEINTEVPPRPLSPEVFIKTFDRSMDGSINKRKRRTPVKASLNSLSSLLTDHQTPYFNIETSANVNENIKEHAQASSDVDLSVKLGQDSSGNANKNFDLKKNKPICQTQEITTSIDISDKPAFNVNHNITTESSLISLKKSPKRKLQPSKIAGILEHPMKKSKNRVKFNPNISEVFTSPSDEEISLCKKSKTADFSSKEVLDESMLKLLHSRNVQVIFQKSKSNLQEHSVSRRNSSSRTKNAGKVNKSASNFQKVKEKSSQVSSSSLSNENEITTSNNSLDAIIDSVVSSAISVQTDSNPSGSIEMSKKSVTPTARMRTGKVPIKSILKRKSISPKHKIGKEIETANMQTSKLQINRTELEVKTPVNEESNMGNNFKSPPIQKRKHKPNKKYDDGLDKNVHLTVSTDQPQALKNVESITDVLPKSKRKRTASTSKSKIVKPRKTTTKRKYCKKVSEKQPSIGAESSETQEGSSSETDDNMPIIYLLSSKSDNSKEKLIEKLSNSVKPINGLFELEKKDVRKRRGRGRKRQKIGRPKNIKVKEEVDADSSFLDEDDDEEHVIAANGRSPIKRKHQKRTGRRYSVTGNWYIASGYLNDILSLLEEFENCDGWRFKDFAKCWQKKSFSLVYRGRQTFKELLEFSEEIALLTMRFIGPSHATKRRIGALYTLYGLYYKFPVGHFFNLRFELEEYKNLLELVHSFRSNIENPDPAYIFRKLELKGAIQHCATACEPCYDFHNEERDMVDLEYGKQKLAKSSAVNIAVPNIQLEADSELLSCYNSTKSKLTGEGRALSLISPEFLSTISSDLSEMRKNAMCELGMTAKSRLNASTTDEEDCNADKRGNTEEIIAAPQTIHKASFKAMLNTVNKKHRIEDSLKISDFLLKLRSKNVIDYMKPPTVEELRVPLSLHDISTDDDDEEPYKVPLPNWSGKAKRISSVANILKNYFNSPSNKKSVVQNDLMLNEFNAPKPRNFINLLLNNNSSSSASIPTKIKSIDHPTVFSQASLNNEDLSPVSKELRISLTKLDSSVIPIPPNNITKESGTGDVSVEIPNDARTKGVETQVRKSLVKKGGEKLSKQHIEICKKVSKNKGMKTPPKHNPGKQKSKYLCRDSLGPLSDSAALTNDADLNTSQFSDNDYESTKKEAFSTSESSDESYSPQRRAGIKKKSCNLISRNLINDEELIQPNGSFRNIQMIPIMIGDKIKYRFCHKNEIVQYNKNKKTKWKSLDTLPLDLGERTLKRNKNFDHRTFSSSKIPRVKPSVLPNQSLSSQSDIITNLKPKEKKQRNRDIEKPFDQPNEEGICCARRRLKNISKEIPWSRPASSSSSISFSACQISPKSSDRLKSNEQFDLGCPIDLESNSQVGLEEFSNLSTLSSDINLDALNLKSEISLNRKSIKIEFSSTIDELVEDWDDDDQAIDSNLNENKNNNLDNNFNVSEGICGTDQEHLNSKYSVLSDTNLKGSFQNEAMPTTLNLKEAANSEADLNERPFEVNQFTETGLPTEDSTLLHDEFSVISSSMSTYGMGNELYCQVKSKDGKNVLIPMNLLTQINSDGLEILSIDSAELKLSSPQYNSTNVSMNLNNNSIHSNSLSEFEQCTTLCVPITVPNHQSQTTSAIPESSNNSPKSSDWNKLASPTSSSSSFTEFKSSSSVVSSLDFPSSVATSSRVVQSSALSVSSPKCSFVFSTKLKRLSNKKLASGRPPTPESKPKPIVKFLFNRKGWLKKSRNF